MRFTIINSIWVVLLVFWGHIAVGQRPLPGGIGSISDVILWLEPDTNIFRNSVQSADVGQTVLNWRDISGNGHVFTQSTNSFRPTVVNVGGKKYLDFENGDFLLNSTLKNALNGLTEFSVYIAIKSDVTNTDNGFLYYKNPPGDTDDGLCLRYDAEGLNSGRVNCIKTGFSGNSANQQVETLSNTQTTERQVLTISWKAGEQLNVYIDGVLNQSSPAIVPGPLSGIADMILGKGAKNISASSSWNGKIGTVIFYSKKHTSNEVFTIVEESSNIVSIKSGNWNAPDTWNCNCIPSATSTVLIKSPHTVTLTAGASTAGINIKSGALLNLNGQTLTTTGNIQNQGIVQGVGNITAAGTSPLFIHSDTTYTLNDLVINNTAVTTLSGARLTVNNVVTINSGILNTGDILALRATPTKVAAIGPLASPGALAGKVRQTMLIEAGPRGYHYMGTTAPGMTLADLKLALPVTGNISNPSNISNKTWPSIYSYNEAAQVPVTSDYYADVSSAWLAHPVLQPVKPSAESVALTPGIGYAVWVRNPASPGSATHGQISVNYTAEPHKGNFSFPVSYTANNEVTRDGWNLVSNPFPSPINGDIRPQSGWSRTRIARAVYVWSDQLPGYISYVNGTSSNGNFNGQIRPGQAFFVKATGANPSLSCGESVKSTAGATSKFFRTSAEGINPFIRIAVSDSVSSDYFVWTPNDSATWDFDGEYDAIKIPNAAGINVGTYSHDSVLLSIASHAVYNYDTIPIDLTGIKKTTFTLSFQDSLSGSLIKALLLDRHHNTLHELTDALVTDTTGGYRNRFALLLQTETTTPVSAKNEQPEWQIKYGPTPCTDELTIYSNRNETCTVGWYAMSGTMMSEEKLFIGKNGEALKAPLQDGIFLLKINCHSGSRVWKIPVQHR